jgi:Aldo/keto reductase family
VAPSGVQDIQTPNAVPYDNRPRRRRPRRSLTKSSSSRQPDRFFLATKTGKRDYAAAGEEIRRSLERLGVDRIDPLQLHNLVDVIEWEFALRGGGALEAAVEARDAGLIRFIGVTGHGLTVTKMHLRCLESFSVRLGAPPLRLRPDADDRYAADFEALMAVCGERDVARYEPLRQQADIDLAAHWVLGRPGVFLNTVGDVTLLPKGLAATCRFALPGRRTRRWRCSLRGVSSAQLPSSPGSASGARR